MSGLLPPRVWLLDLDLKIFFDTKWPTFELDFDFCIAAAAKDEEVELDVCKGLEL